MMSFVKKYFGLVLVAALAVVAFMVSVKSNGGEVSAPAGAMQEAEAAGEDIPQEAAATGDYFENFRREREEVRKLEMEYLDEVIAASASDDETLSDAQQQKLALVNNMEKEFTIESLVKAKGFEDAAVTFHAGAVNVVVKGQELSEEQVAQILDIARQETGEPASSIKVMTGE